jgi:hypothetical protein
VVFQVMRKGKLALQATCTQEQLEDVRTAALIACRASEMAHANPEMSQVELTEAVLGEQRGKTVH